MAKISRSFQFENRTTYSSLQERTYCPLCEDSDTHYSMRGRLYTGSELYDHLKKEHVGG